MKAIEKDLKHYSGIGLKWYLSSMHRIEISLFQIILILFFSRYIISYHIKMSPKRQISLEKRAQIIALFKEGFSQVKIAEKLKCSRNGVQTTIKRYKETSSINNRAGQGRKRCTTPREDRWMKNVSLRDRRKTSSEVAAEFREVSNRQISN